MPRRLMLILSSFGISAALIGMGTYFHLKRLDQSWCNGGGLQANDTNLSVVDIDINSFINGSLDGFEHNLNCMNYTESIRWLPLLLLMIYIFFFNLGYGAMIWITVVEILPLHVRSVATSLSVAFTCICSFLTSHTYTPLKESITVEGVFWLYGSMSFAGLVFITIFVPETKGKNEAELSRYFAKKVINAKMPKNYQANLISKTQTVNTSESLCKFSNPMHHQPM